MYLPGANPQQKEQLQNCCKYQIAWQELESRYDQLLSCQVLDFLTLSWSRENIPRNRKADLARQRHDRSGKFRATVEPRYSNNADSSRTQHVGKSEQFSRSKPLFQCWCFSLQHEALGGRATVRKVDGKR